MLEFSLKERELCLEDVPQGLSDKERVELELEEFDAELRAWTLAKQRGVGECPVRES